MTFVTGRLYLSTNSSKARRSPRLTRSIRAASGSRLVAMGFHAIKNPRCHKVAGNLNDPNQTRNETHPTMHSESLSDPIFGLRISFVSRDSSFGFPSGPRGAHLPSGTDLPRVR